MADDADLAFRREQLRNAIARLKEEQQRDELEAVQSRPVVARLLPDPNPEQQLRKLVAEFLAVAAHVPGEPSDTINSRNAGRIIVEAAVEELHSALTDLLVAVPSGQPRRNECLRAACHLLRSALTIARYDIGGTPSTVRTVLGREQAREQARIARLEKQRKASDADIAFREAVEQRLREGTALADLKPGKLRKLLPGMLPRRISRHLIKYKKLHAATRPAKENGHLLKR